MPPSSLGPGESGHVAKRLEQRPWSHARTTGVDYWSCPGGSLLARRLRGPGRCFDGRAPASAREQKHRAMGRAIYRPTSGPSTRGTGFGWIPALASRKLGIASILHAVTRALPPATSKLRGRRGGSLLVADRPIRLLAATPFGSKHETEKEPSRLGWRGHRFAAHWSSFVLPTVVGRAPFAACPCRGPASDQRLPAIRRGA